MVTRNTNKNRELARYAQYRGLYARVARELKVDRSYVSRVARGERRSKRVGDALQRELKRIQTLR
jgi:hypothetical protein